MSRETPTLTDVLEAQGIDVQSRVHTLQPGTVVAYDQATNTATVQPSRLRQPADGGAPTPLPTVTGPVIWPRTGAYVMWTDLLPGDSVAIMCAERSISKWRKSPTGTPELPQGARMHSLADTVILPGLYPDVAAPPLAASGRLPGTLYIGNTIGTAKVTISPAGVDVEGTLIRLGEAAALAAARVTDETTPNLDMAAWITQVTAAITAMAAVFNAPPAPMVSLGPGSVVPPVPPVGAMGVITTGSAKVQVE